MFKTLSARARAPRRSDGSGSGVLMRVGLVGLFATMAWRATLGADLSDDAHVVALTVRLARGAIPFDDEMNVQALGALPAVPFTWVWLQLFGTSGLVIALRLYATVVAFLIGYAVQRMLRLAGFRAGPAAAAAAVPLLAPAYNLQVLSYNTTPLMAGLCAATSALVAVRARSGAWAAVCAACVALGAVCYPPLAIGGAILLVVMTGLARCRRVLWGVLLGGGAVALGAAVWYVAWIGLDHVQATLDHTSQFLEDRTSTGTRFARTWEFYLSNLTRRRYWPLWALVAVTTVRWPRARSLHRLAALGIPLALLGPSLLSLSEVTRVGFGSVVAVHAVALCLALAVPVVVDVVRRRDALLGTFLALTVPLSLVQAALIVVTTSSGAAWGVLFVGLAPLAMPLVLGWFSLVAGPVEEGVPDHRFQLRRTAVPVATVVLVGGMLALLVLKPFKDGYPWQLTTRVTSGAFAGTVTTSAKVEAIEFVQDAVQGALAPGDSVLFYGSPGGYLLTDARPVTNVLWLVNYGPANIATVRYFERKDDYPSVVFVHQGEIGRAGGLESLAARDAFVGWLLAHSVHQGQRGPYEVFSQVRP